MRVLRRALVVCAGMLVAPSVCYGDTPEEIVRTADQVLHEIMTIPAREIPREMLSEAQGVAIIPSVIKVGFIGGIRHGKGVVLVRTAEGQWTLPQFVSITGGSIGWQAGAQSTDVVLVFRTQKSVEGLLQGKFTLGVDAAAAAGPVGRQAAAATDAQLRAEILSYSRSRGLFAGVSFDGSALQIDAVNHMSFYGAPPGQSPLRVPDNAARLTAVVAGYCQPQATVPPSPAAQVSPGPRPETLRTALVQSAAGLNSLLDDNWRSFLALPADLFDPRHAAAPAAYQESLARFDRVAHDPSYGTLAGRAEFRATHHLLRQYVEASRAPSTLALPPPPPTASNPQPARR